MQLNNLQDKLIKLLEKYDDIVESKKFDRDDVRFISICSELRSHLGDDGFEATTSVPRSFLLEQLSPTTRKQRSIAVRTKLVKIYLQSNTLEAEYTEIIRGGDEFRPFRARPTSKGNNEISKQAYLSFNFFKSGALPIIIGLMASGIILWAQSFLTGFAIEWIGLSEQISEALIIVSILLTYGITMAIFWLRVKDSLSSLIDPMSDAKQFAPGVMAGYIASTIVAGTTIMLGVLTFDYFVHSAAYPDENTKPPHREEILIRNIFPAVIEQAPQPSEKDDIGTLAKFGSSAGTFGDFFGGVINPILTFGTLIALIITLLIQRRQLTDEKGRARETARALNIQTFENTFFNLLNLHSNIIAELRIPSNAAMNSADFPVWGGKPKQIEEKVSRQVFSEVMEIVNRGSVSSEPHLGETQANLVYSHIQNRQNYVLGHYFRNLYQILAFIDRYSARINSDDIKEEYSMRKRYTNMLRAQLSSHELSLLFYNCSKNTVDSGAFRGLLIEWCILEHIPLRYSLRRHYLYLEGYDQAPVDHMIDQYLGNEEFLQEKTGAFGSNPAVLKYLIIRNAFAEETQPVSSERTV